MKRLRLSTIPAPVAMFAMVIVPLLIEGCAKPPMTNMWKDPNYSDGTLKKVLAIAVRKDPVRRRIWEDSFVEELRIHGVSAVSSYKLFPAVAPDTQQVDEAVRKDAFDGVVVSLRLPNTTEETYVPGYVEKVPVLMYRPFSNAYATYWKEVDVAGYMETTEVRRFRTDVWATRNGGRLIWSGTIEATEAVSYGSVGNAIGKGIVPQLVSAGILPPKVK